MTLFLEETQRFPEIAENDRDGVRSCGFALVDVLRPAQREDLTKDMLTGNAAHGNYMLGVQLSATVPTGSYSNGSTDASVSPTLLAGKGFGRFDIISALGGTLPTGDTNKLGRSIAWNTTAQYHLGKYLWPEVEANTTYYLGGSHDGKTQNFLSPGLTTSKFKFHPGDAASRSSFVFGAGIQIATSQFDTYNHELVFTGRFYF